ncbi:C-type lectin-related protein 1 [Plakobranchus ocellatus]|uniref:C-type lectin-related protein 1 n=1 Tax=Plakobranchus ocellatus TaxID=259542 RepID=A0AAV4C7L7_9GAST|nr:C-type lectin-related protein 1 [Plakobranchus ocellatus]
MSERAASLRNYPMVMVMVLSIATFAKSAKATTSAMDLDVSHTIDLTSQSALLVVNCSFDAKLTDMVTGASLTLFGSKAYGNQSELAVVNSKSQTLKLTSDLEDADVVIKGKSGQHSYLAISWDSPTPGYRQYYKCVANGIGRQEQDSKLKFFQSNLNLQLKMVTINDGGFDVSDISKGRVYLASKAHMAFNIGAANQTCKSSGGYLVELDDREEFQFVSDFATLIGGTVHFWTGCNDIEREGHFVYFNSKKPVPFWAWASNQPDNGGAGEDCVEIRLNFDGLNDLPCDTVGNIVCEVELF